MCVYIEKELTERRRETQRNTLFWCDVCVGKRNGIWRNRRKMNETETRKGGDGRGKMGNSLIS